MPHLSVLMAGYRSGTTIESAVRSTLKAMPRDSELVVAIDGPDEPTLEAVQRVQDPRLDIRARAENIGLARQLQYLTDSTDSALVARMDSDDVSFPWRFRATVPALKTADFVFSSAIRFGAIKPRPSYPAPLNSTEVNFTLLMVCPLFHPTMVTTRAALMDIGGYRAIRYAEDYELWLRAAAAGKRLVKVAAPTIAYRLSPNQMSAAAGVFDPDRIAPDLWQNQAALAARMNLPAWGPDARLSLTAAQVESLLTRTRPINRRYMRSQIGRHATVVSES